MSSIKKERECFVLYLNKADNRAFVLQRLKKIDFVCRLLILPMLMSLLPSMSWIALAGVVVLLVFMAMGLIECLKMNKD